MGNRKNLPQHGTPRPALSLMLNEFTEKKLRRRQQWHNKPQHNAITHDGWPLVICQIVHSGFVTGMLSLIDH
jgi:hypothetical protein